MSDEIRTIFDIDLRNVDFSKEVPADDNELSSNNRIDVSTDLFGDLGLDLTTPVETDSDDSRLKFLPSGPCTEYCFMFNGRAIFTFTVQPVRNIYASSQILTLGEIKFKGYAQYILNGDLTTDGLLRFLRNRFAGLHRPLAEETYNQDSLNDLNEMLQTTGGVSIFDSGAIIRTGKPNPNLNSGGGRFDLKCLLHSTRHQYMSRVSLFGPDKIKHSFANLMGLQSLAQLNESSKEIGFDCLMNLGGSMPKGVMEGSTLVKGGKTKLSNEFLQFKSIPFRKCDADLEPYLEMVSTSILHLLLGTKVKSGVCIAGFGSTSFQNTDVDSNDPRVDKQRLVYAGPVLPYSVNGCNEAVRRLTEIDDFSRCLDSAKFYNNDVLFVLLVNMITDALVLNTDRKNKDVMIYFFGKDPQRLLPSCNFDQAFNPSKLMDLILEIRKDPEWSSTTMDDSQRIKFIMNHQAFESYMRSCHESKSEFWGSLYNVSAVFECIMQLQRHCDRKPMVGFGKYLSYGSKELSKTSPNYLDGFIKRLHMLVDSSKAFRDIMPHLFKRVCDVAYVLKGLTNLDELFIPAVCSCGVELHPDVTLTLTAIIRATASNICEHWDTICKVNDLKPLYTLSDNCKLIIDKRIHASFIECDIGSQLGRVVKDIQDVAHMQLNQMKDNFVTLYTNPSIFATLPHYQDKMAATNNEDDFSGSKHVAKGLVNNLTDMPLQRKRLEKLVRDSEATIFNLAKSGDFDSPVYKYNSSFIKHVCTDVNDVNLIWDKDSKGRFRHIDTSSDVSRFDAKMMSLSKDIDHSIRHLYYVLTGEQGGFKQIFKYLSEVDIPTLNSRIDNISVSDLDDCLKDLEDMIESVWTLSLLWYGAICEFTHKLLLVLYKSGTKRQFTTNVYTLYLRAKKYSNEMTLELKSRNLFNCKYTREIFDYVLMNQYVEISRIIKDVLDKDNELNSKDLVEYSEFIHALSSLVKLNYLSIAHYFNTGNLFDVHIGLGKRGYHEYFEVYERLKLQFDGVLSEFRLLY